ncbi:MAG: DUF3830 family protein [Alphaproteobacteria bacterium]|nr:DUF3830 family protein [Alphaproteobacteria bacterium]
MAGKQLYLRFTKTKTQGLIDLYEENAPVTCATIWKALKKPIRVTVFHAMFAGPEIMTGLPKAAQTFDPTKVPIENQTVTPAKGEMLWYYQGKNVMKGLTDELWELGMFYDHGGRTFGPLGWTPVNILGIMRQGIDEVAEECRGIRLTGAKEVEIGRHKG